MRGRPTSRRRPAFGSRLAAMRNQRGLTQDALARQLRINRTLLRYYERETSDPRISVLLECAKALAVPASLLLENGSDFSEPMDPAVRRFADQLMSLNSKQRMLALRLFAGQISELRRQSDND
jgi:transcriptional regulator with XRE-family HTH domain